MRPAALALVLAGCAEGPSAETLVDDVQVIAAIADPPRAAVGDPVTLTVTIADPRERGAELLGWTCLDGDCPTARAAPVDGQVALDVLAGPPPIWLLACAPDRCGLDDPDLADLEDPYAWMARLPLDGVSLATRTVPQPEGTGTAPAENPVIAELPPAGRLVGVPPGDRRKLPFVVPGAARAWGYATAGGFARPSEDVASDGAVTLTWYAPDQAGAVSLYVVFEDDVGGAALWQGTADVTD